MQSGGQYGFVEYRMYIQAMVKLCLNTKDCHLLRNKNKDDE